MRLDWPHVISQLSQGVLGAGLLVGFGVLAAFALAVSQSFMGSKIGSDHPVHAFLARAIRQNQHRLFVRIPKLLNTAYCAALPLYIHWLLSFFQLRAMYWAERLLNPGVNTLHVVLFAGVALWATHLQGLPMAFAGLATCVFALTPQFYHALSARNFGLSARGTGLLLLTSFYLAAYAAEAHQASVLGWGAMLITGWLVWSFSTFGQQALVIISLLLLLTSGRWIPLAGTALGLALFLAVHPAYGRAYLRHTLKFIQVYANELAPIYILNRRHSIWRDLVWDIWAKVKTSGLKNGFRYAYDNSVLVLVFLNPFVLIASLYTVTAAAPSTGLLAYAGALALAGALAMLLTSFRATRFLGEPERYVEVVTPWAVLAGGFAVQARWGMGALALVALLFLALNLAQLMASHILVRYITSKPINLSEVEQAIGHAIQGEVRCCSNNEQITKMLMQNDWWFAYCIAVGQDYCGMSVTEAFSVFPYLRRDALQRIVTSYRINACVLDRSLYDTLFDSPPAGLVSCRVGYQSDGLRLLLLQWDT